jgi:hypothetical protein
VLLSTTGLFLPTLKVALNLRARCALAEFLNSADQAGAVFGAKQLAEGGGGDAQHQGHHHQTKI